MTIDQLKQEGFRLALEDGVLTVTLDRPDRINALTFASYAALRDAFRAFSEMREVRAILLHGQGPRGFCSGGDVRDIIGELFSRDMRGLLEFTRMTGALVAAIHQCRAPVITALHGVVCGAGAVIAIASDVRYAAPDARIAFLFPKVGLSGADMGASWLLPRIVGHGRASELLLTGEFVDAERAERIGLFNRVSTDVLADAKKLARTIADGPAFAHAMTKKMLDYEAHVDFATGIEAEAQAQAICMQHPDFREAYDAWVEKRAPRFER
ncbi:enoyl-CoA hydratase family protein [Sandaracinus amylolyticus]|uniref:enoyl-CoA hydratase family protein n=1 Tax=Sandaracinus amylolyticus TaxID=927083 RepID=UPI001F2FF80E|nr:enoyl-CoA hydratase family protein [Sandaracinus amylolyticus]UJR80083.1 Enoyl-CoA hydratase/carnithine racemase [Sandaracinus amylolyticus]